MASKFLNLIESVLTEHKGDEAQDQKLKKTFKRIITKKINDDKKVEALFKAVQKHLKESGMQ